MTLSFIQGHKEERRRKRGKKSKAKGNSKHKKHRKGKHSHSFVEIEDTAPKSTSLLQLTSIDGLDLTTDEGAELELKGMFKKI